MTVTFRGLIAPTEVPTGDGRMFAAGKMTTRPLPIPLLARFGSGGHDGAVPVGNITRIFDGPGGYWCEGEFFDPGMVQEVPKAVYLLKKKALGPSVDLDRDFTVESIPHPMRPDKKAGIFKEYNVIGITLVPMPAFHQVHMAVDDDSAPEHPVEPTPVIVTEAPGGSLLASALLDNAEWSIHFDAASEHLEAEWAAFDVNGDSWRNWPIAPRDYTFDADDAVKRIAYWSGIGSKTPNIDAYASTFLWRNGNQAGSTLAQDSFRLPLADIVNGEPHLVYHAVYSAAALLSGGHGGIPMIPDADKTVMVRVINEIYSTLAEAFQDPNLKSPFLVGVRPEQMALESGLDTEDCGCNNDTAIGASIEGNDPLTTGSSDMSQTITVSGGNITYAATSETINPATVTVTFTPAGLPMDVLKSMQEEKKPYDDSGCHFNQDGFCETHFDADGNPLKPYGNVTYADPGYQGDNKKRYPLDTTAHVRAAWSYINMPKNASKYTRDQLNSIKEKIRHAAKEHGIEISDDQDEMAMGAGYMPKPSTLMAGAAPVAPPSAWFSDPGLAGPTRLTISDDGHVFGHLAQWRICHVGVGNSCVMAPKSKMNYNLFKVGTVRCDDGTEVQVGKITLGTGHANAQWGVMPSREHYDNTGWAAAVVGVGEDRHGIWVNGALTNNMTPERVAELRAAALSGDWRTVNGNLELIAALAVNNPGFPIYREANGRAFSLVSVGVLSESDEEISGEFSMSEDSTETPETEQPENDKAARLAEITGDWDTHKRQKRLTQLAMLDEEREKVAAPKKPANRMYLYADRDAKLEVLQED